MDLVNEVNNEDYIYYTVNTICDVSAVNDTYIGIHTTFHFKSSNTSGEVTYFKGEFKIDEL